MQDGPYHIVTARSVEDIAAVATLFSAYVEWLDIDLAFQDFDAELKSLPGKYAPPGGELWLARNAEGTPIGCIALRPLHAHHPADLGAGAPASAATSLCEIKRLYVSPTARGLGLGRALIATALSHAQALAYGGVRLDTLASMTAPLRLYREAGFVEIPPYYASPLPDTVFLGLTLGSAGQ
jgi:ribosomal protein S18 acetylase RimI-like enzyme